MSAPPRVDVCARGQQTRLGAVIYLQPQARHHHHHHHQACALLGTLSSRRELDRNLSERGVAWPAQRLLAQLAQHEEPGQHESCEDTFTVAQLCSWLGHQGFWIEGGGGWEAKGDACMPTTVGQLV
eukprot:353225-Chlamydomonas_euryale.AAC.6